MMSSDDSIYYYHYYGVLFTDPRVVSYLSNALLTITRLVL